MVGNSLIISSSSLRTSYYPQIPNQNFILLLKSSISQSTSLQFSSKPTSIRRISAANRNFVVAEANSIESEQIVAASSNDSVSNVISALLFLAFVGLSVLTIGVIYIAVTDYLQKREKEKFEKEESANKKKKSKKKKVKARTGPKGFGQKLIDDDDDESLDV